jgi:hypothetical protein
VIDAAGAIFVIGGSNSGINSTYFNDVWVSTDGGARRDSGGGYTRWVLRGYYRGEVLEG